MFYRMSSLVTDAKPPSLDQVCERALRLPCSPALLPRLITVLQSDDSSADDIAEIIKVDPGLASSTLRLANSAFLAASTPAESVSEAVMRLGQHELYRLASLALVSRWESGAGHGEAGDFCRHALCTALAAEVLAETTERASPQIAYTAGLVCDLGKLAMRPQDVSADLYERHLGFDQPQDRTLPGRRGDAGCAARHHDACGEGRNGDQRIVDTAFCMRNVALQSGGHCGDILGHSFSSAEAGGPQPIGTI